MFGRVLIFAVAALILWSVVARASNGAGPEQVYIVKPHDTLWSIATKTYGGDPREGIWKLEQRNDLAGATIVPGEKLVLPG
jgi:LysM repeat protein